MKTIDVEEVLCKIKTETLIEELQERLNILRGWDRKAADEELDKDAWRNSNFIEIEIEEENVIDNMDDEDLLDECKLRKLIPDDFIAMNYLEAPLDTTIRHIKRYSTLQFKPINKSFKFNINTINYDKRRSV